ncbi:response regulator transcription factor [Sediminibacterium roseum]|uniref:Response regulator transcription factor n=1 Tax=Sediminibacterium roseum TaxID=1978412 RepID=A0ABW9ZYN4_9BACT|nr:LytTR family DNA-binding domain-containing protein [Sediminibacterium roseum]NCI51349.1 response regulator transcription factor [Sediminibacterium roseum]
MTRSITTCIIVDDEPIAQQILEQYVMETPGLTLLATCRNAMEALSKLEHHQVDLIFLDIEMPLINGLNFLKTLTHAPAVILTTAYPQYAVEAFALNAVDYLLKPFSVDRFQTAVQKVISKPTPDTVPTEQPYLLIREKGAFIKVPHHEIIYFEASGDYVKIVTAGKTHLASMTMKSLEETLPANAFIRIHKSYIVAVAHIQMLKTLEVIMTGKQALPLSPNYKDRLLELFSK